MIEDIKIDRERLYKLYMDNVNYICDQCEDISHFTPKEKIMNELRALYNPNEDLKLDEALKLIEKELDTSS
jgi:hypothetical protein